MAQFRGILPEDHLLPFRNYWVTEQYRGVEYAPQPVTADVCINK